jgi:hypothetical protein
LISERRPRALQDMDPPRGFERPSSQTVGEGSGRNARVIFVGPKLGYFF